MAAEDNLRLWVRHLEAEFTTHSEDDSVATMVEDASVNHVPTGVGGVGKENLRRFYREEFIPSIPEDWNITLLNRVMSDNAIAEESRLRFHHTRRMDWFLPGVEPTGKPIEVDLAIFVDFRDGLMTSERIYWDMAAALRQIGVLPQA